MSEQTQDAVRRRRVFYIPGYDPFPARRYRELYRTEAAKQALISGFQIDLSSGDPTVGSDWQVMGQIGPHPVEADFEVLHWSDIVRASMRQGFFATYFQLLRTVWIYVATGAFRHLLLLRRGPVAAALYPIVMLLAQLLVAIILAWTAGGFVSRTVYPGTGWIVALPILVVVLRWFRAQDKHLYAYYLMHDYAFAASHWGATPPELKKRMDDFQARIAGALAEDLDEVLVVGHSSGAHLAIAVLANIVRTGVNPNGPALSFLSLGHVVPMVSFLPQAQQLRADLHDLSRTDAITWIDISAPSDGCSFALCDPVAVTGVAPAGKLWPLVLSAAFTQTLSTEAWQELRWRYFRLHFQYLCAFDQPGDYDYFRITAGSMTLAARFDGRQPSKSRIDVAASPYTSMTA